MLKSLNENLIPEYQPEQILPYFTPHEMHLDIPSCLHFPRYDDHFGNKGCIASPRPIGNATACRLYSFKSRICQAVSVSVQGDSRIKYLIQTIFSKMECINEFGNDQISK